jgi:hypothetical protein
MERANRAVVNELRSRFYNPEQAVSDQNQPRIQTASELTVSKWVSSLPPRRPELGRLPALPSSGNGNFNPSFASHGIFPSRASVVEIPGPSVSANQRQTAAEQTQSKILTSPEILSTLVCPVCSDYFIGLNIYVCLNGHSVCGNCHPGLAACPTCEGDILNRRNHSLEKTAASVNVKCPHSESGCLQVIVGREYRQHISLCRFG